jgi:molybdate transport system substrate-binding protein
MRLLGAWLLLLLPLPAAAQRAPVIAAAASVTGALTEAAAAFTRASGARVELVFGASGTLTRQIQDGAPFELFLAADEDFPAKLHAAGLTRDAGVVYAVGRLAIFAPRGSPLRPDEHLEGLARLLKASGANLRFAIANPDVAPYGRAAQAVLRKRGLWQVIQPALVLGDTVAQAAQFATTGNAGGLVAYSLVVSPEFAGRGAHAVIPQSDHMPLRQRMVLLKRAGVVASRFYAYLQTEPARAILRTHGFAVPE